MTGEIQLCPCCAAHLRVPAALIVMRCNHCNFELVRVDEGGVSGLAVLPPIEVIPYSVPGNPPQGYNMRELLHERRYMAQRITMRAEAFWGALFYVAVGLCVLTLAIGYAGFRLLAAGNGPEIELGAMELLGAMTVFPVLAYTAGYFQSRARLERESLLRWR